MVRKRNSGEWGPLRRRGLKSLVAVLVALAMMGVLSVADTAQTAWAAAAPAVDGDLSEWSGIAQQASTDQDVSYWQIAKDADGNVYLALSGTAITQWVDWQWKTLVVTVNGSSKTTQFAHLPYGGGSSDDLTKGSFVQKNLANGNSPGPIYVEVELDSSSFGGSDDYSVTFAGTTVAAADIPVFGGSSAGDDSGSTNTTDPSQSGDAGETTNPTTPDETSNTGNTTDQPSNTGNASGGAATYNGITIDGNFSDWDAIQKTDAIDPNPEHPQNLAAAALVFDHDYAYIYVQEGPGGSAAGAGTHSNGQFSITTDLGTGNELLIQLHDDHQGNSSVTAGDQTVESRHVGAQWEIAVPKSMLPHYQKTINFGLYQQQPIISNVANLDTGDPGNAGDFNGIRYDGDFSDWTAYPHTRIQYATAGTQEHVTDASGALYSDGSTLFTHVRTTMPEHLKESGGEFLWSVTYNFGDNRILYPTFAEVDGDGTMHWYSGGATLPEGTHELYIFATDGWHNSTNINNLSAGDTNYGKVTVKVDKAGQVDEMESEIDLATVAKHFQCDTHDFKTIKAQFGRLGQEWIETAGTSTAPWLGTGIAIASVVAALGIAYGIRRRRAGAAKGAASGDDAGRVA